MITCLYRLFWSFEKKLGVTRLMPWYNIQCNSTYDKPLKWYLNKLPQNFSWPSSKRSSNPWFVSQEDSECHNQLPQVHSSDGSTSSEDVPNRTSPSQFFRLIFCTGDPLDFGFQIFSLSPELEGPFCDPCRDYSGVRKKMPFDRFWWVVQSSKRDMSLFGNFFQV